MFSAIIIGITIFISNCQGVVEHPLDNEPLTNRRYISEEITLEWQFVEDVIIFRMIAMTTGWVGVGISPNPSMIGADLIFAGVKQGGVYVLDAHSKRNGPPTVDQNQFVDILSASENETHTAVTVLRMKETFDLEDISVENGGSYYLLWAFGQNDITGSRLSFQQYYHGNNRGYIPFRSASTSETTSQRPRERGYSTPVLEVEPVKTTRRNELKHLITTQKLQTAAVHTTKQYTVHNNTQIRDFEETSVSVTVTSAIDTEKSSDAKKYSAAFAILALALLLVVAKRRMASLTS